MDPLMALVISLYIAGKFTSNVTQDVAYTIRGEEPPSFQRERRRWEHRRAKGDGPARKLIANAWADACAAADERRARLAQRAADRRRAKWAQQDLDAAEEEARKINERVEQGETEQVFICGGCKTRIRQSDVAGYALSGDPLCRDCRTGTNTAANKGVHDDSDTHRPSSAASEDRPAPEPPLCPHCVAQKDYLADGVSLGTFAIVHEPHCPRHPDNLKPNTPDTPDGGDDDEQSEDTAKPESDTDTASAEPSEGTTPEETASEEGEEGTATVTDINAWRAKGSTPPITREDLMSGEVTNLSAALTWTQSMADQSAGAFNSIETSLGTLQAAKVTGPVIGHLQRAMDLAAQLKAAFEAAHAELVADLAVKDAYQARQGAGDKQFVTQE